MEDQNVSFESSLFLQKIYCSTSPHKTVVRKKLVHVISLRNKLSLVGVNHEALFFFLLPLSFSSTMFIHTLADPVAFLVTYRFYFHILIFQSFFC